MAGAPLAAGIQPKTGMHVAPRHVAVIMDGNGRWAKQRNLPRIEGHRRGVDAVRRCVRVAMENNVDILTIFSFSSENWSRPLSEVNDLLGLMKRFIRNDLAELHASGVRVRVIGEREDLAADIRALIDDAEALTRDNTRLTLVVAFNYGGRQELVRAARRLAVKALAGEIDPAAVGVADYAACLDAGDLPEVDLLIRTSGEMRISNFLLWQLAYAELVFTPVLWPDFEGEHFLRALDEFRRRDRRFGGLAAAHAEVAHA